MANKFKIVLVVSRIVAPPVDGGAKYVYNIAKGLSNQGHEITFVSFKSDIHPQSPEMIKDFADIIYDENSFHPFGFIAFVKSLFLWKPISVIHRMNVKKMNNLLQKLHFTPDFFFLEGIHSALMIDSIRSGFPKSKIILRQANTEYELLSKRAARNRNPLMKLFFKWQSAIMYRYEARCFRQADGVTGISNYDLNNYQKMYPDGKYLTVPMPMDVKIYHRNSTNQFRILLISDWSWHPNLNGLVWFLDNVVPKVINKKNELLFEIVGKGLDDEFIEKHKHSGINFHGFVDDLTHFFQNCDIFAAPLLYGGGIKIKVVEALSNSMPVITTTQGIEGLSVDINKDLVVADTADDFAEQIINLSCNPELRNSLSLNALKWASTNNDETQIISRLTSFLSGL